MLHSLAVVFPIIVAVPGLFIPLYVISRMASLVADPRRPRTDRTIARVTAFLMLLVMGFSLYAAQAVYTLLNGIGG